MNTVKINDYALPVKEYQGQRVVTLREIDEIHGRPSGTAGRNFRKNKKHFIEGKHYFKVYFDEIRRGKVSGISSRIHSDIYVFTMMGYLMLTKSFTDDLSWRIQDMLVETYFAFDTTLRQQYEPLIKQQEERQRIIKRNLESCYKDWCEELIEPLQIIQQHYNLTSQTAALVRVYYIFSEVFGATVGEVREVYIQRGYGKHEDYEAWKKKIRSMPMLKFIHEHPGFKYEIDHLIQDIVAECTPTYPINIPQESIAEPMLIAQVGN